MTTDGARLGILMLDTRFPRVTGDVANPATWPFAVRIRVVKGAGPRAVVGGDTAQFVAPFVAAGRALVAEGCTGIATTCGFLAPLRNRLSADIGVPVAASALEQAAQIIATLPAHHRLGILTISAADLSPGHLAAAGVPPGTPVQGLDTAMARREMIAAARTLIAAHPDVGAILMECTNMPPYADAVAQAVHRPVFSIVTYLNWFHAGLMPPRFQTGPEPR